MNNDFQTLEKLQGVLEEIGMGLHAKNRIVGGESLFLWHLAEALRATGRLASAANNEPKLEASFGNGYQTGNVPSEVQLDHFLALLKVEMINRR
jgi:hypothetical protein